MNIYIKPEEIGTTITYKEDNGRKQYLYVHDREGFVFKSTEDLKGDDEK